MAKRTPQSDRPLSLQELAQAGYRMDSTPDQEAAPAAPESTGTLRRILQDGGISLLKGAIGVPEAAVGLADIATGGQAGKLAEEAGFRPKEAKAFLDEQFTPETKEALRKVQAADGFVDTVGTALANPSAVLTSIGESLPSVGAGGVIGRGVMAAAPKLAQAAPRMAALLGRGTSAEAGAAAIGEGVVGAGQAAEQYRQATEDGLLTGKQAALAGVSGVGDALFGLAGGKMANKLGIGDIDTMAVRGMKKGADGAQAAALDQTKRGVVRKVLEGAVSEGLLEELPQSVQEQVLQNMALGKPLDEGVGQQAALGMLAGMAMGGAAGPLGSRNHATKAEEIRAEKLPDVGPMSRAVNANIEQTASDVERGALIPGLTAAQENDALTRMEGVMDGDQKDLKAQGRADNGPTPPVVNPGLKPGDVAASAEAGDSPFADRVLDLGKSLQDPGVQQAIKAQFGDQGMNEALYYLNAADNAKQNLPDRTRDNMLALAEAIVSRAVLQPVQQDAKASINPEQGPALGAQPAAPQIELDATPTGTIRVDGQGNAAPEVRADQISARQRAEEAASLGQAPKPRQPAPSPRMAALANNPTLTGALRVNAAGQAAPETAAQAQQTQALQAERESLGKQTPRGAEAMPEKRLAPVSRMAALTNSPTPTGRLIAGADGVRAETAGEAFARQAQAEKDAELGLTPDVRRATAARNSPRSAEAPAADKQAAAPIKTQAEAKIGAAKVGGTIKRVPNGWAVIPPAAPAPTRAPSPAAFKVRDQVTLAGNPWTVASVVGVTTKLTNDKGETKMVLAGTKTYAALTPVTGEQSNEQGQTAPAREGAKEQAPQQASQDQAGNAPEGAGANAPAAAGPAAVQADGVSSKAKKPAGTGLTDAQVEDFAARTGNTPENVRAMAAFAKSQGNTDIPAYFEEQAKRKAENDAKAASEKNELAELSGSLVVRDGKVYERTPISTDKRVRESLSVKPTHSFETQGADLWERYVGDVGSGAAGTAIKKAKESGKAIEESSLGNSQVTNADTAQKKGPESLAGKKIDDEWTGFKKKSGTLSIPRAAMPQIKAEHRGAMVNFLAARGITHEQTEVPAGDLKPTQAEFSPGKVEKAKAYEGGDRSILVSSDGHVLDGHHQWLAKREAGEQVKVIRLDAPIKQLLETVKEFPSAETADGATEAKEPAVADSAGKEATWPEQREATTQTPSSKIDDFGEKLHGARKDYATSLHDAMAVDVKAEPLGKSWPEPNYQKLLDGGADPFVVAWVRAARDEVAKKPLKTWKLDGWAKAVTALRGVSSDLLDGKLDATKLKEKMREFDFGHAAHTVGGRAELYQAVGHEQSLRGVTFQDRHFSLYRGESNVTKWMISQEPKSSSFGNWPRELAVADTKEAALAQFKERFDSLDLGPKAKKQAQFTIYSKRGVPGAFVGKKIGREYVDLKRLDSLAEARQYLQDRTADLEKALEKYKQTPFERNETNQPRVGDDHRNGAAVTPEVFGDTFGFRGVQFGNYVEQGRRQSDLNQAFDALMDLAAVLGLPARAISLNGRLGLAFGARGKGGVNSAAAHFEPGNVVINLTKGSGPGSLAHEWWHALDNYFARQGADSDSSGYVTGGLRADKLRAEMKRAFDAVMRASQVGALRKRSAELDKRRSKPYWDTDLELSARSFESYIIAKLRDQSAANDYLANVVSPETWDAIEALRANATGQLAAPTYPYPLADEMPGLRAAFDEFFKAVELRTDEGGNVAMFSRSTPKDAPRITIIKDPDGNPELFGDHVELKFPSVTQRVEQIEGPGQQILNYVVMPAGRFEAAGYVDLLMENGQPVSLLDMAVRKDVREQGTGRHILETILAAYPNADLNISNIIPKARGFWEKMGIPAQNVEGAYDGNLNWQKFAEATKSSRAREKAAGGRAAREGYDAGREEDAGSPARGAQGRQEQVARVEEIAQRITAQWANAPKVVIFDGMADPQLPQAIRDKDNQQASQGASGEPEGVYFKGVTYLNASALKDEADVRRVLFHEALGHYGMRGVYGNALDGILAQIVQARPREVAQKARDYGFDTKNRNDVLSAAEEVLAEMAQSRPELGFVRRAVAAIRTFLRKIGLKNLRITDDEIIRNYILPARRFVERGGPNGPKGGQPAKSKKSGPSFSRSKLAEGLTEHLNSVRGMALPAGYVADDFIASHGKLGWWQKTVGTPYNLAKKNPAFRRVFDAVQNFLGDVSSYATEAADLAPSILPKLDTLADLKKSPLSAADTKALSRPVFEGTLSWRRDEDGKAIQVLEGDNAPAGIVFTPTELKSIFGLNDGQVKLYQQFRAATDESLRSMTVSEMVRLGGKDLDEALREKVMDLPASKAADLIEEALMQAAKTATSKARADALTAAASRAQELASRFGELTERGYAPLSRFGTYSLDVLDDKGARVYFGLFESQSEANRMARRMRAAYPGAKVAQGTMSQEAFKLFSGVSPETMEIFGELLGLDSTGDSSRDAAFQEYIKRSKATRSAMKRLIHRQGIAGFIEDAGRVLAGFIYSNARATSGNLHQGNITEQVQAIADTKGQGELADYAVKMADYVKNPQEEAQGIRGMMFAHFLGGSVASAMVNLTQPVAVTFPYLSQFGGVRAAANNLRQAFVDMAKGSTGDSALDKALKDAEEDGTVSPQEVFHLMAQAQGKGSLQAGDGTRAGDALAGANNGKAKVMLIWGKLFGWAELVNRRATFIAAYRMAPAGTDPAKFAAEAVTETQFTYNKGNKPQWARGTLGSLLFTFKQYSVSYIELIGRMANSGPEGRKAALLAVAVLAMTGGADELPFMKDAEDVIDGVMLRLGYNFNTSNKRNEFLAGVLGKDVAQVVAKGVTGIAGMPIDLSGRLGMGNLIPGTGLLTKKQDYTQDVLEVAGPAAKLAQSYFKAAGSLAEGNVYGAAQNAAPTAAANFVKGLEMAATGQYNDTRGRKVLDTTPGEALAKGIGFQPNSVAKVQEAARDAQRVISAVKQEKQEIAAEWAEAMAKKDQDGVEAARQRLLTWNRNNPEATISRPKPSELRKRAIAMQEDRATRMAKTAPKEIRAQVKKELAAATAD